MKNRKHLRNIKLEQIFLLFVIIQPLLDLATSFSIFLLKSEFTLGIITRFLMMFFGIVYLFFSKFPNKKRILIYLFVLCGFFFINIVNNLIIKEPIDIGSEIKFIIKSSYFIVMLFTYLFVFYKIKTQPKWDELIQKYVVYAMTLIGITMVVSAITGTAFNSYQYEKIGHKGWFFAGNELGAIMSICFPVTVLFAVRKTTSLQQIYYWLPPILLVYSLLALGTKVGYGAAIITIFIALTMMFIQYFLKRKEGFAIRPLNIAMAALIFTGVLFYTPFSPVVQNTQIHLNILKIKKPAAEKDGNEIQQETQEEINDEELQNLVFSGRDQYLSLHKKYFQHAPLLQKLFGMGYAGNYEKNPKLIEMDFHDLFFSFGIAGFILYIAPIAYIMINLIFKILSNAKTRLNLEKVLIGSGIALGLGIAFTAGHVLTAPAVSIYLAILIAYLFIKTQMDETSK
jgi:hypothetical protein